MCLMLIKEVSELSIICVWIVCTWAFRGQVLIQLSLVQLSSALVSCLSTLLTVHLNNGDQFFMRENIGW